MDFDYFIDSHLHFHDPRMTRQEIKDMMLAEFPGIKSFFDNPDDHSPLLGILDGLRCKQAWIINYESPDVMGYSIKTNDWVSEFCDNTDGRLIPIGGIHPGYHPDAAKIMRDYFESGMLRGLKVHGPHQHLKPNAYTDGLAAQAELYSLCEELQIPVIFHTGSSIFPRAKSRFGYPLYLEDVLIDFPDMIVIMAHGGRPFWMRESEYLMAKFADRPLYMDIAGVPPKFIPEYFPRFNRYADRCIFGSDYPSPGVPGSRENAETVSKLPLPPETIEKILFRNAEKIMSRK